MDISKQELEALLDQLPDWATEDAALRLGLALQHLAKQMGKADADFRAEKFGNKSTRAAARAAKKAKKLAEIAEKRKADYQKAAKSATSAVESLLNDTSDPIGAINKAREQFGGALDAAMGARVGASKELGKKQKALAKFGLDFKWLSKPTPVTVALKTGAKAIAGVTTATFVASMPKLAEHLSTLTKQGMVMPDLRDVTKLRITGAMNGLMMADVFKHVIEPTQSLARLTSFGNSKVNTLTTLQQQIARLRAENPDFDKLGMRNQELVGLIAQYADSMVQTGEITSMNNVAENRLARSFRKLTALATVGARMTGMQRAEYLQKLMDKLRDADMVAFGEAQRQLILDASGKTDHQVREEIASIQLMTESMGGEKMGKMISDLIEDRFKFQGFEEFEATLADPKYSALQKLIISSGMSIEELKYAIDNSVNGKSGASEGLLRIARFLDNGNRNGILGRVVDEQSREMALEALNKRDVIQNVIAAGGDLKLIETKGELPKADQAALDEQQGQIAAMNEAAEALARAGDIVMWDYESPDDVKDVIDAGVAIYDAVKEVIDYINDDHTAEILGMRGNVNNALADSWTGLGDGWDNLWNETGYEIGDASNNQKNLTTEILDTWTAHMKLLNDLKLDAKTRYEAELAAGNKDAQIRLDPRVEGLQEKIDRLEDLLEFAKTRQFDLLEATVSADERTALLKDRLESEAASGIASNATMAIVRNAAALDTHVRAINEEHATMADDFYKNMEALRTADKEEQALHAELQARLADASVSDEAKTRALHELKEAQSKNQNMVDALKDTLTVLNTTPDIPTAVDVSEAQAAAESYNEEESKSMLMKAIDWIWSDDKEEPVTVETDYRDMVDKLADAHAVLNTIMENEDAGTIAAIENQRKNIDDILGAMAEYGVETGVMMSETMASEVESLSKYSAEEINARVIELNRTFDEILSQHETEEEKEERELALAESNRRAAEEADRKRRQEIENKKRETEQAVKDAKVTPTSAPAQQLTPEQVAEQQRQREEYRAQLEAEQVEVRKRQQQELEARRQREEQTEQSRPVTPAPPVPSTPVQEQPITPKQAQDLSKIVNDMNSATDGFSHLRDLIVAGEAGRNDAWKNQRGGADSVYDVSFGYGQFVAPQKQLTDMSINEVRDFGRQQIYATKGKIGQGDKGTSALGAYQFIGSTMNGLIKNHPEIFGDFDPNTQKFDAEFQDKLLIAQLQELGLQKYLDGKMTAAEFQNKIANTWQSVPRTDGSYMAGGAKNLELEEIQAALSAMKAQSDASGGLTAEDIAAIREANAATAAQAASAQRALDRSAGNMATGMH